MLTWGQRRILKSRADKLDEMVTYLDGLVERARKGGLLDEGQLKDLDRASTLIEDVVMELGQRLEVEERLRTTD